LLSFFTLLRFFSIVSPAQNIISKLKGKEESGENDETHENAINPA
jgi:hypothetical protein